MHITIFMNGNSGNNGVMAMAVGLHNEIKRTNPSIDISVLLDNPFSAEKDGQRFAKYGIETVKGFYGRYRFKNPLFFLLLSPFLLLWQVISKPKKGSDVFHIKQTDVLVSLCGEDFFSDNWHWFACILPFLQCLGAFITKRPLIVLAQTFGPFEHRLNRWLVRFCLSRAKLVTARDANSFEILNRIGISGNSYLTSDLAFLLEPDPIDNVIQEHKELQKIVDREFIGISVSKLFGNSVFSYIKDEGQRHEIFFNVMALALDNIVERYGMPLVFVPQVTIPENNDREAAKAVVQRMKYKDQAIILEDDYTASAIKAVIGRLKFFVGCRMHALIAAVSQGVPTLALAYSPKTINVIGSGFEYEYVIDVRDLPIEDFCAVFADRISTLLANGDSTRKSLVEIAKTKTRPNARRNIDLLLRSVGIEDN